MIADAHLSVDPESELTFTLSAAEATPRCTMTLRHQEPTGSPVAFKVKTTQPRRYLVRPNQGLIESGGTQQVQILLVEKEKTSLLQSYQRLGQTALDHSKDKFLVQSVTIDTSQVEQMKDYDNLTSMWATVGSGGGGATTGDVTNRKLHVRHVVEKLVNPSLSDDKDGANADGDTRGGTSGLPVEQMSQEQLATEMTNLRRKYDELVAFSVNLTAERDILSNTLEQTKRDLSREVAKSASQGGSGGGSGRNEMQRGLAPGTVGGGNAGKFSLGQALIMGLFFLLLGVRLEQAQLMSFLTMLPIIGRFFQR